MMCRWTLRGAERLTRPGAQQRPGHLGGWFQHDGQVAAWLEAFLPAWLEGRLAGASGIDPRAAAAYVAPRSALRAPDERTLLGAVSAAEAAA